MKIEVQDEPFGIPFSQVKVGEVFKWNNCYYVRLDVIEPFKQVNSVNLTTNALCCFSEVSCIEPVNAKLVISE